MAVVRLGQPAVLAEVVEADDLMTGIEQLRHQVAVDEPGGACDEDSHAVTTGLRATYRLWRPNSGHNGRRARYVRTTQGCWGNRLFVVYGMKRVVSSSVCRPAARPASSRLFSVSGVR